MAPQFLDRFLLVFNLKRNEVVFIIDQVYYKGFFLVFHCIKAISFSSLESAIVITILTKRSAVQSSLKMNIPNDLVNTSQIVKRNEQFSLESREFFQSC